MPERAHDLPVRCHRTRGPGGRAAPVSYRSSINPRKAFRVHVTEQRSRGVAWREQRLAYRPRDAERVVIPADHMLVVRRVEVGALVEDNGDVGDRLVSVRVSSWDIQLTAVALGERVRVPAAERWRADADVDHDVVHLADENSHELGLPARVLEVQATYHPAARTGGVVLHEAWEDGRCIRLITPGLRERPTRVTKHLPLEQLHLGKNDGLATCALRRNGSRFVHVAT